MQEFTCREPVVNHTDWEWPGKVVGIIEETEIPCFHLEEAGPDGSDVYDLAGGTGHKVWQLFDGVGGFR